MNCGLKNVTMDALIKNEIKSLVSTKNFLVTSRLKIK